MTPERLAYLERAIEGARAGGEAVKLLLQPGEHFVLVVLAPMGAACVCSSDRGPEPVKMLRAIANDIERGVPLRGPAS